MSEEEYYEEENIAIVGKESNGDWKRKLLTYGIIFVVAFAAGSAAVGIPLWARENRPRKNLESTDYFLRTIFDNFTISVFNSTSESITDYSYDFNNTAESTFLDIDGAIIYVDEQLEIEYLKIFFDPVNPDLSIENVFFRLNKKSELNLIILADGREVFNARSIKDNIDLEFQLFSSEIVAYVF